MPGATTAVWEVGIDVKSSAFVELKNALNSHMRDDPATTDYDYQMMSRLIDAEPVLQFSLPKQHM